jgi:hypothetical protein
VVTRATEYVGFVLERERTPLKGRFSAELAESARDALALALLEGATPHRDQRGVARAASRLDEYWRRSGGTLDVAQRSEVLKRVRAQLDEVTSWEAFLKASLELDVGALVPKQTRSDLDALPSSAQIFGDRVPLLYDLEGGAAVARLRLREKQARRLRKRDLPRVDRPLRFSVYRGKREVVRASALEELREGLRALERRPRVRRSRRRYR